MGCISNMTCVFVLQLVYYTVLSTWMVRSIHGQYSGQGYTSVLVLPDLTEIDLSHNNIIGNDFLAVHTLLVLNLKANTFTTFPDFALTPLYRKYHQENVFLLHNHGLSYYLNSKCYYLHCLIFVY